MKRVVWILAVVGALSGLALLLPLLAQVRGMSSFSVWTREDVEARAAFDLWIAGQGYRKSSSTEDETRYGGPVTVTLRKGTCRLDWSGSGWGGASRSRYVEGLRARIRAWWESHGRLGP